MCLGGIGEVSGRYWGGIGEVLGRYWGGIREVLGSYWGGIMEVLESTCKNVTACYRSCMSEEVLQLLLVQCEGNL